MFYITFLTFSYISLGVGVWTAMRHKAILRREEEQKSDDENQRGEFIPSYQMSPEESAEENRNVTQEIVNEQMRLARAAQSAQEPQTSGEMTEQLVGMAEDSESNDLSAIVQQLQEIHNLASEADIHCYASEDVENFITPEKERYATTAICRPKVGCKKSTVSEAVTI